MCLTSSYGLSNKLYKTTSILQLMNDDGLVFYIPFNIIQLLTIEVWDMMWYPPENTNIDRGDSRGQYWYSVVDINFISNTSIVNNCFIIQFVFSLDNYGYNGQHQTPLI